MPGRQTMPSTVRRSAAKAQRTWRKTHDAAVKDYGEGERAHRTAFAALEYTFERRGDRWMPKQSKGASVPRAKQPTAARRGKGKTFGGVDYYGSSHDDLYDRAKRLGVKGRSAMTKAQLATAIAQRQKARSLAARRG